VVAVVISTRREVGIAGDSGEPPAQGQLPSSESSAQAGAGVGGAGLSGAGESAASQGDAAARADVGQPQTVQSAEERETNRAG
jgi:hypothetical protein